MPGELRKELQVLVECGNTDEVYRLVKNGLLSDLTSQERNILPRLAAKTGRLHLLRVFCEQSHVVTQETDKQGRSLLHYAAMSGQTDLIAYVVEKLGYDPLEGDSNGETPLDTARRYGHAQALGKLEDYAQTVLENTYRNPIRRGFYPDPSVVRVGDDFYMVNSTFVQFPCIPVSHSRDLVHWHTIGHAIEKLEWSGIENLPGGHGYWAPDISYYKGRFWIIATLRRDTPPFRLQMITSSARPEGPYDKPHFLDINGIDPSIFTDADGRRYVVINPGAQIVEIDDGGQIIGQPEMIYYGSARVKTEGPHIIRKDGWYYLFQAEGGTGQEHMETVARSRTLRGRYEPCPFNPILGRKKMNAPIRRSGHGKPVQLADGRWYMVYLCGRDTDGQTMLGRETALDPMTWTADGWPMVNGLKGPGCLQKMPLPSVHWQDEAVRTEDFISPRGDFKQFAKCANGVWNVKAGEDPREIKPVGLLLRRQSERRFTQTVRLDASRIKTGLAGLAGYYDENSFFLYGLFREESGWKLILDEQIGTERRKMLLADWDSPVISLCVEGDGLQRTLLYQTAEGWQTAAVLDAAYLSDEGLRMGKRFTGATLGVAAVGSGEAVFEDYQEHMAKDDGSK